MASPTQLPRKVGSRPMVGLRAPSREFALPGPKRAYTWPLAFSEESKLSHYERHRHSSQKHLLLSGALFLHFLKM